MIIRAGGARTTLPDEFAHLVEAAADDRVRVNAITSSERLRR
ncbi:MAG: hypothetical protein ACLPZR_31785 [Solirubrobacteraceae bacterium]